MDAPDSADDVAIVTAIVQMGRSLQLATVAEGVETAEQMALLRNLGCDLVQGHLISEPMDAPSIRQWLTGQVSILATSCTPFPIQSTPWRNRPVSGLYY